jgi:hypothetical protein
LIPLLGTVAPEEGLALEGEPVSVDGEAQDGDTAVSGGAVSDAVAQGDEVGEVAAESLVEGVWVGVSSEVGVGVGVSAELGVEVVTGIGVAVASRRRSTWRGRSMADCSLTTAKRSSYSLRDIDDSAWTETKWTALSGAGLGRKVKAKVRIAVKAPATAPAPMMILVTVLRRPKESVIRFHHRGG